jgi:hypothetical protein
VQNLTNRSTKLWWQKKTPCFDDKLFGGASKLSLFAIKIYHTCQRLSSQNDTPTPNGRLYKISPIGAQSCGGKKPPCFYDNLFGGASKLSLFAIKTYHTCQRLSAQNDMPTLNGLCKISPIGAQSCDGEKKPPCFDDKLFGGASK